MLTQYGDCVPSTQFTGQNLITVTGLSSYLAVSPSTIYRMVGRRIIPFIRLPGGNVRFKQQAVVDWVDACTIEPLPRPASSLRAPSITFLVNKASPNRKLPTRGEKSYMNYGFGAVYIRYTKAGIPRFYLDYNNGNERIQRVCRKAMNYEDAWWELRQAVSGERGPKHKSFADFADEYVLILPEPSNKSRRIDTSRLRKLKEHFGKTDLRSISPMDLEKFRCGLLKEGKQGSTTNRYIALIKRMLNLAIDEGYLESNPARKVKLLSEEQCVKERILSESEEGRLIENLNVQAREIVSFALNTGMRLGEILKLKWRNVNMQSRMINVEFTKSGKARKIPINSEIYRSLTRPGRSMGDYVFMNPRTQDRYYWIGKSFRLGCRNAGIVGLRFHDLRHTFASRLAHNGVDIDTVRKLLGHSTLRITQRYVHSGEAVLRQAVEGLVKMPA